MQQPISLRQPIQAIITLPHRAHESTQRIDVIFSRVAAVLVDLADADLDGGVVFGFDDAVRCAAFAGDVTVVRGWELVGSSMERVLRRR